MALFGHIFVVALCGGCIRSLHQTHAERFKVFGAHSHVDLSHFCHQSTHVRHGINQAPQAFEDFSSHKCFNFFINISVADRTSSKFQNAAVTQAVMCTGQKQDVWLILSTLQTSQRCFQSFILSKQVLCKQGLILNSQNFKQIRLINLLAQNDVRELHYMQCI